MNSFFNILKIAKKFDSKNSNKNQYIYHIKNKSFRGKYIYPLSELKEIYPDIYKKEIKKYETRKQHPKIKIDIINTTWEDCVNFSTLNPIKIFQLEELLGTPGYKNIKDIDVFRFNIKDLKNFDMCLYDDSKSPKNDEAYKKINPNTYKETQFIPNETTKYFIKSKDNQEYPLLFGYITHLLVKGKVPVSKADIINFED